MIKVFCRTNLDRYEREIWPKIFCCVPQIGDRVRAKSQKSLKIVAITHCVKNEQKTTFNENYFEESYLEIELDK